MKELDLPPETEREKIDRQMKEMSARQTQGLRDRMAKDMEAYDKQVKEVMEGLNVPKAEAERIVNERILGIKKKKSKGMMDGGMVMPKKKKKTKAKKMMGGGKVYSRGSRKANYSG